MVKTKFYLWGLRLRLENFGIGTLKTFTLDVSLIAQDWSWISFLVSCLMSACAKWCRKPPRSMQYLKNPLNCRNGSFCVYFSPVLWFAYWMRGTRFVCFLALQGESSELENVLSGFIMRRLFYWCALSIKSHRVLNTAATVCCNHSWVKWKRRRNNCSPVWCLMVKVNSHDFYLFFFFSIPQCLFGTAP